MPLPPKSPKLEVYHVFLASPRDMEVERRAVRRFFDDVNREGWYRGVRIEVLDWENAVDAGVGRPQELITAKALERFRPSLVLVVGLLGKRFGTPTGEEAESGTEKEFKWALKHCRSDGFPEIKWFFREHATFDAETADPQAVLAAAEQWAKVQAFRERLEGTDEVFSRAFPDGEIVDGLRHDLALWMNDPARPWHREGEPPPPSSANWTAYLKALIEDASFINIRGITGGRGSLTSLRRPIEELYTPLRCRGIGAALAESGDQPLSALLPGATRLLIEGQPGAGKTTFLRLIACLLARDVLGRPEPGGGTWRELHLGLDPEREAPLPVFVRLGHLVPLLSTGDAASLRRDDRRWLLELLASECQANEHPIDRAAWQELLTEGRALLLLDGLDEVADPRLLERVLEIFHDACRHWEKCRMVVSSRPIETAEFRQLGFEQAVIEPFGEAEIRLFLSHWTAALHAAALYDADRDRGPSRTTDAHRDDLVRAIVDRPRVRGLAANPVMLTCLCVVHWNEGRLPEGRARVYEAVMRWLIAARAEQRTAAGFPELALAMMTTEAGKRSSLDLADAAAALEGVVERFFPELRHPADRRQRALEWLLFEALGSGVVEEVAGRRIRFWHLTFQEYLAAQALAWLGEGDGETSGWWPPLRERLDDAQWRETVELFPGCLFEGGAGQVDRLLDRVLALRGEELASQARVAGIFGRLLPPLEEAYGYRPRPAIQEAYAALRSRALAIFSAEGAAQVPVAVRIAAAEALGQGGDPRLVSATFLEVPGLDGLRLGQYPVTVEEYQHFVEHGGYEEPRFWDAAGWKLRQQCRWEEPGGWSDQLQAPNRPVTQVSWYEACAYGRWLSDQRGEEVRLPWEAEWERAAMSEAGRYSWDSAEVDAERANFARNVGRPTPVGVYPAGAGPYGHLDMTGNVWEWCLDEIGKSHRMLRGGSWLGDAGYLRSAFRVWDHARVRLDHCGFRVCCPAH